MPRKSGRFAWMAGSLVIYVKGGRIFADIRNRLFRSGWRALSVRLHAKNPNNQNSYGSTRLPPGAYLTRRPLLLSLFTGHVA